MLRFEMLTLIIRWSTWIWQRTASLSLSPWTKIFWRYWKSIYSIEGGEADDWLFCSVYGKQLTRSSNYNALWDYCHERGVEQTGVHRFRHTFAKKWAIMGGSVVTLQKILGHSSLAITEGYLNLLTSDLKKEMDEVNIIRSLKQEHIQMRAS